MTSAEKRRRFHELHTADELFVMPNPWDVGSAVQLQQAGFPALATTSSGFAMSHGRDDGDMTLDELISHTSSLASSIAVPLSVDAERCFAEELDDVAITVERLAEAGAAGLSIEDWSPDRGIDPMPQAIARVATAVDAASMDGLVVTARAENLLRGYDDLDDTMARLAAFADAGAHCVYAPGLTQAADIERVVAAVDGRAVNVLALPSGPSSAQLADLGVRRVSTGGALARRAYGAALDAAVALRSGHR